MKACQIIKHENKIREVGQITRIRKMEKDFGLEPAFLSDWNNKQIAQYADWLADGYLYLYFGK